MHCSHLHVLILGRTQKFVRVIFEKVVLQQVRDSQQQFGVQTAALENMIHIIPFAIEIAGEPCDGSLLTVQFVLYQFADVYHTPVLCKYLLIVGYVVGPSVSQIVRRYLCMLYARYRTVGIV